MFRPVHVSDAQDQLLGTALVLYRVLQRLHRLHRGLRLTYQPVRKFYEAQEPLQGSEPRSLEVQVAEETDMAADALRGVAEELLEAAGLTEASVLEMWQERCQERS